MKIVPIVDKEIRISELANLVVGLEHKAETVRFTLDKVYADETDLSQFTFYLQYKNRNGQGEPILLTKSVSGNVLNLDWQPTGAFTQVNGRCQIQVFGLRASGSETNRWSTRSTFVYVAEELSADDIVDLGPTVLIQYLAQFQALEQSAASSASSAESSATAALASKNSASSSATSAASSASAAATSAAAALASKNAAATSESNALASRNTAATKATDAAASALEAKGYRDEAMAISGVGNHVTDPMPHQNTDENGENAYKYGFRITSSGTVQFCYEEVS